MNLVDREGQRSKKNEFKIPIILSGTTSIMKVEKLDITFGENIEGKSILCYDKISLKYKIVDGFLIADINAILTRESSFVDWPINFESEKVIIIGKTDLEKIPDNVDLLIPIKKGKRWSLIDVIVSNNDGIIIVTDLNNCEGYAKSYFYLVNAEIDVTQSLNHWNLFTKESNEAFLMYLDEDKEGLMPDFSKVNV